MWPNEIECPSILFSIISMPIWNFALTIPRAKAVILEGERVRPCVYVPFVTGGLVMSTHCGVHQTADNPRRRSAFTSIARPRDYQPNNTSRARQQRIKMSLNRPLSAAGGASDKSAFEQQREALIGEIAMVRFPSLRGVPSLTPEDSKRATDTTTGTRRASSTFWPTSTN